MMKYNSSNFFLWMIIGVFFLKVCVLDRIDEAREVVFHKNVGIKLFLKSLELRSVLSLINKVCNVAMFGSIQRRIYTWLITEESAWAYQMGKGQIRNKTMVGNF